MPPVDPKAFGARVRQRREELGWSQARLAAEAGYKQQNIGWIEEGGPKRPERSALALATALKTSPEWLLRGAGPRNVGPKFLTNKELVEKYEALPDERKADVSRFVLADTTKKRKSS